MTFLLALIAAIVGGAVGAGLGMAIAGALAPLLGIGSFEGESAYFAVFIGGPTGALLGIIIGTLLVLRWRGIRGFGAIAGRFGLVVVGIAAVGAAIIGFLYLNQDIVNPNGPA